jgi:hypothetical protein
MQWLNKQDASYMALLCLPSIARLRTTHNLPTPRCALIMVSITTCLYASTSLYHRETCMQDMYGAGAAHMRMASAESMT